MSGGRAPAAPVWPNDALARDSVLHGYRITRILGRGGFGITYVAEDVLGQDFAIKEYFPRQFAVRQAAQVHAASAEDEQLFDECRARFVHEARALVSIGRARSFRDDIVKVQTFFEANGTAYMVMEHVVGRSLQAMLREHRGGMPEAELRRLLTNLLDGLGAVHDAGLMHRDIKPANILLREDGRPVLIDFGSSRESGSPQTQGFTQIYSGGYAPPEQILGTRQGAFSDVYAVGAVCYEAIGGTVTNALARQQAKVAGMADPMPPATRIGAGRYAKPLLAVIDAALVLDPAGRPASAAAMAHLLQPSPTSSQGPDSDAGDGDTMLARPMPAQKKTTPAQKKTAPRRRARLYAAAIAGSLGVAAAVWLLAGPVVPPAPVVPPPSPSQQAEPEATATPDIAAPAPLAQPPVAPTAPEAAVPLPPVREPPAPEHPVREPPVHEPPLHEPPVHEPPVREPPVHEPPVREPAVLVPPAPQPPAPEPPVLVPPVVTPPVQTPAIQAPPVVTPPVQAPPEQVPASPPPAPPPAFRLADARALALAVPCALIDVRDASPNSDRVRYSVVGPALPGAAFDAFLRQLRGADRTVDVATVRLDRVFCPVVSALRDLVRRSGEHSVLRLAAPDVPVPVGGQLEMIALAMQDGALYVDLYGADETVRHLLRRNLTGGTDLHVDAAASGPPGQQLLTGIATAVPLDLGQRPATENAVTYLRLLQRELARIESGTATPSRAEIVTLSVVPAARPPAPPPPAPPPRPPQTAVVPPHAPSLNSSRCADILTRVQLGEGLSDADRSVLRTFCKP